MISVKKYILSLVFLVITTLGSNAQYGGPNNCELCYLSSDQAVIAQCLIDYNCEIDVPIDFGIEFLVLSGIVLFFIANRKYKFTN